MRKYNIIRILSVFFLLVLSFVSVVPAQGGPAGRLYATLIYGPVPVRSELSPDSPILGMANRGATYRLENESDNWVTIVYKGKVGWIEKKYVDIHSKKDGLLVIKKDVVLFSAVLGGILFLVLLITFVARRNTVKAEWFSTTHIEKKILIVATKDKVIEKFLTDNSSTIEKCFSEIGFTVKKATNSSKVRELIFNFRPDAIAVDWEIGSNAQQIMEQILVSKANISNILVIFYNVPDEITVRKSTVIPNTQYLGLSFTDRELFEMVTPVIITGERKQNLKKSVETSALKGTIAEGSISEVLQFIEIGRKSGCLLINDTKPKGIIYFDGGVIVYASTANKFAKDAVFEMLEMTSGDFNFVVDKKPQTTNCTIPTLSILMEWTKDSDEASRDRLRTP